MTSSPLVSVIIPTHNRQAMLAEAIASVRAQTFTDYEIIVVANGEDNPELTCQVAKGCRFIRLKEGNRSKARNVAINEARGEWIAFLDDDDTFHVNKLDFQVSYVRQNNVDCVFTDFLLSDVRRRTVQEHSVARSNAAVCKGLTPAEGAMIWRTGSGGCSTALVKRDVLLSLGGFDERMVLCEDWDMWRRISQRHRVAWLPMILVDVRTHGVNGEAHTMLRPWRCAYWDSYHYWKLVRHCPPHLRHMRPRATAAIARRVLILHPIFVIAGLRILGRRPLESMFRRLKTRYRPSLGREVAMFRQWLRPRRRINALLGRELFPEPRW